MTSAKLLFSLQEFDLRLDLLNGQITEAKSELSARSMMEKAENSLNVQQSQLEEIQVNHKSQQIEAETLKERSTQLEAQLYSGEITNPRDLASLELECGNVKAQIDRKEIGLLELTVKADDLKGHLTTLQEDLEESQKTWDSRQAKLNGHVKSLNVEKADLTTRRDAFAAGIDQSEMGHYEHLRKNKGGTAVAKVERGLCQACRLFLPTQHLQKVKSGKQTVLCSSCGRMLFLG